MAPEALRAAAGPLGDVWHWWIGELKSLMPGRRHGRHRPAKPYLLLTLEGDLFVLNAFARSGDVELGRATGDVDGALGALDDRRYRKQPIVVRLAKALGLRKILDLPGTARADLDRLLYYELDRLTPFKAADVCFAWRIVDDDRDSGRIKVRLDLAPKALVESTLRAIRGHGLEPWSIALDGDEDEAPLDLTPPSAQRSRSGKRWRRPLSALVIGLGVLVVAIPLRQQSLAIDRLDADIRAVQAAAEASGVLREDLQRLAQRSGFLIDRRNGYRPRTNVMNALTRLIPDQAYVTQLQIQDDRIVLVGHADRASELIGTLEQSPWFASPRFQSPLTRDPRTGKERFQIAVDLAGDELAGDER